jgi:hypothetical protein
LGWTTFSGLKDMASSETKLLLYKTTSKSLYPHYTRWDDWTYRVKPKKDALSSGDEQRLDREEKAMGSDVARFVAIVAHVLIQT